MDLDDDLENYHQWNHKNNLFSMNLFDKFFIISPADPLPASHTTLIIFF